MKNIKGIVEVEKKKLRDLYKNKRNNVYAYLCSNPDQKEKVFTQLYQKLLEIFKHKEINLEDKGKYC
jgi:hypothetical protein